VCLSRRIGDFIEGTAIYRERTLKAVKQVSEIRKPQEHKGGKDEGVHEQQVTVAPFDMPTD
jgi:hypothetical protein